MKTFYIVTQKQVEDLLDRHFNKDWRLSYLGNEFFNVLREGDTFNVTPNHYVVKLGDHKFELHTEGVE